MGTRSFVGVMVGDKCRAVYVHWDGYLEGVGAELQDYTTQAEVEELISQTEAFIDMIVDGQEDMTRDGIQETLKGVKESTGEFLNDLLGDLQFMIEARLREVNYGAAVTGIKYDLAGDVTDIEVDVSVS